MEKTATLTITDQNFVVLDNDSRASTGFSHKIVVTAADVSGAAAFSADDTLLLTLCTLPATSIVTTAAARVVTAFTDAVVATLAVGLGADVDAVVDEFNPNAASVQKFVGTGSTAATATALVLNVVPESGADLNNTAAGELHIFLRAPVLDAVK